MNPSILITTASPFASSQGATIIGSMPPPSLQCLRWKKKKHVTLLHVLTPFCHSCLYAGEIYFWLGEEDLQIANSEKVLLGVGVMQWPSSRGRSCSLETAVSSVVSVLRKVTLFPVSVFPNLFCNAIYINILFIYTPRCKNHSVMRRHWNSWVQPYHFTDRQTEA